MIDLFFFSGCNIQNDCLAMVDIALKYESSKGKCNKIQVHYQLKFDKPQAGYSYINYDMTEGEKLTLAVAETVVDAPSKEKGLGFYQGNVKLFTLI
jgi:hypothetical protein